MSEKELRKPHEVGPAVCRWGFRFLGGLLLIAVWLGHWFLLGTWPTPFKLWLSSCLGAFAIADTVFWRGAGLRATANMPTGTRPVISDVYLAGFFGILFAAALFFTWLLD